MLLKDFRDFNRICFSVQSLCFELWILLFRRTGLTTADKSFKKRNTFAPSSEFHADERLAGQQGLCFGFICFLGEQQEVVGLAHRQEASLDSARIGFTHLSDASMFLQLYIVFFMAWHLTAIWPLPPLFLPPLRLQHVRPPRGFIRCLLKKRGADPRYINSSLLPRTKLHSLQVGRADARWRPVWQRGCHLRGRQRWVGCRLPRRRCPNLQWTTRPDQMRSCTSTSAASGFR